MLDAKRCNEMFYLFGRVLPIYNMKEKHQIENAFGVTFEEIVPALIDQIGVNCTKNPDNLETFETVLDFVQSAILYMKCEIDTIPQIEVKYSENNIIKT